MRLYLLRHGETDWNRRGCFQGRQDIPLNDAGRGLAAVTRDGMPPITFDRVYCSPLCRAVETAHIVLADRFALDQIVIDPRIQEIDFGPYEGTIIKEASNDPSHPLYNLLWHPEQYDPGDMAESIYEIADRARTFLHDVILPLEQEGCQNVLLVAHGAIIRAFVVAIGAKAVADFWGTRYLNCCLTTLDVTEGQVSLVREAEIFYDPANYIGGWQTSNK